MPSTIASILVFAAGLLPGFLGDYAFDLQTGSDWRDRDWERGLRIVGLSIAGLTIYALLAAALELIPPLHVIPGSYAPAALQAASLLKLLLPLAGQSAFSVAAGFGLARLHRRLSRSAGVSADPSTWDHFVRQETSERWIVVTLSSGEVYTGVLHMAERGVAKDQRDIILRYPSLYDETRQRYVVQPYRDLFLPASRVEVVGTLWRDGEGAQQLVKPGQVLFEEPADVRLEAIQTRTPQPLGAGAVGRDPQGRVPAEPAHSTSDRADAPSPGGADEPVSPAPNGSDEEVGHG